MWGWYGGYGEGEGGLTRQRENSEEVAGPVLAIQLLNSRIGTLCLDVVLSGGELLKVSGAGTRVS